MNKTATSRQALLEAAREIARRDGLGHISIRRSSGHAGCTCQGCPCAARRIYGGFHP